MGPGNGLSGSLLSTSALLLFPSASAGVGVFHFELSLTEEGCKGRVGARALRPSTVPPALLPLLRNPAS